jgi:ABC-type Fe3+ transport system substrate-binding protein
MIDRFKTGACILLALAVLAVAAAAAGATLTELAGYTGADRTQRLIEGGKKEGTLTVYSSAPPDDMLALTTAFEKKHGIKVQLWRASSENIVRRGVSEARAGRHDADVFETNAAEMESLYREKVLHPVKSPHIAELVPQAIPAHREWIGTRLNVFVLAYNTRLVRKEELPKSYEDLLHPRWKGRLGIEASDLDWFAGVVNSMGEAKGLKLFRDIVATNGMSVRKGHTLLTNLVVSGEVPLALTVYQYKAEQLKNNGAPIDWLALGPVIARFQGVALAKGSPHPHAALLFFDFMLTDAQELLARRDFSPASRKISTTAHKLPFKLVDPKLVLDENDKWTKLYSEIITRQAR